MCSYGRLSIKISPVSQQQRRLNSSVPKVLRAGVSKRLREVGAGNQLSVLTCFCLVHRWGQWLSQGRGEVALQCKENENTSEFVYLEDSGLFPTCRPPELGLQLPCPGAHVAACAVLSRTSRDSPEPHQPQAAADGASVLPGASSRSVLGSGCAQSDSLCGGRQKEVIRNV